MGGNTWGIFKGVQAEAVQNLTLTARNITHVAKSDYKQNILAYLDRHG